MKPILSLQAVSKTYRRGDQDVKVLSQVDLEVAAADFVSLMGPSGSGKTTLLNIIAGIDNPTSGRVVVAGTDITALDDAGLSEWRTASVGLVFQQYNLLPVLTAAENVELPLLLYAMKSTERRRRALAALEVVGLNHRADHYPRQMSGGEEQRTAIARALVTDPKLLIADEPTGNLDAVAAKNILDLLQTLNRDYAKTILMVTHDPAAAQRAKRLVRLHKGELATEPAHEGRAS
jgi:putative ABC transport system ATP-binding protein